MSRFAFLGLGAMGQRMARRLVDHGHSVTVWNRTPARAEALVAAGAHAAPAPRDAAEGAEIVFAMVTGDDASREVWLDPARGAQAALAEGAIAVDCSTLTPAWVRELAESLPRFVDAPVVGTRPHAEAGQLVFLAGGRKDDVDALSGALEAMGSTVRTGAAGTGATMKLAVNALFGVQVALYAEILGWTEKSGVPRSAAMKILNDLPVTSPVLERVSALMAEQAFDPNFPIDLVEKDFRYVVAAAEAAGAEAPIAAATRAVYARARDRGWGEIDISGIARLFGG